MLRPVDQWETNFAFAPASDDVSRSPTLPGNLN